MAYIGSVTISGGGRTVTLDGRMASNIDKMLAEDKKKQEEEQIRPAPEVKRFADILIRPTVSQEAEHPTCAGVHRHLESITIFYGFLPTASISKGKAVWAKIEKVQDKHRILLAKLAQAQAALLLTVGFDVWKDLTEPQKLALMDHELCHVAEVDPIRLQGHDIEEFSGVVDRHGFWQQEVIAFAESVEKVGQEELPLFSEEKDRQGYRMPARERVL